MRPFQELLRHLEPEQPVHSVLSQALLGEKIVPPWKSWQRTTSNQFRLCARKEHIIFWGSPLEAWWLSK